MRTLINIITVAFVAWALYFAWKTPTVQNFVHGYAAQTKSDVANIASGTPIAFNFKSIGDSISNLMNMGEEGGSSLIPKVVTPGPLTQISTSTTAAPAQSSAPAAPRPGSGTLLDTEGIIIQTNVQRADNGVATLSESQELDASALVKAKDILARQYFEHTAPDGTTVTNLVEDQGYTYIKIGENLALGDFTSDTDVVTAWMNSPGHRANILDPDFQNIGVGVAYGIYQGHYVYVAVQHFGKPTSACPSIDQNLKDEVTAGQAQLTTDANTLQAEKAAIDQGTAAGTDESAQIDSYNAGVQTYQADYAKIDAERVQYNNEVTAFNQCVNPTS